jgi:hypothetical protein
MGRLLLLMVVLFEKEAVLGSEGLCLMLVVQCVMAW